MGWTGFPASGAEGPGPPLFPEKAEREHWLTHCEILFLHLEVMNYFI